MRHQAFFLLLRRAILSKNRMLADFYSAAVYFLKALFSSRRAAQMRFLMVAQWQAERERNLAIFVAPGIHYQWGGKIGWELCDNARNIVKFRQYVGCVICAVIIIIGIFYSYSSLRKERRSLRKIFRIIRRAQWSNLVPIVKYFRLI